MTDVNGSEQDKTQVALSLEGNDHIEHLTKIAKWFLNGQDAYKTAVSVALSRNATESDVSKLTDKKTKYHVGGLDDSGALRDLICLLRPEFSSRPYAASEWLAEYGLFILRTEMESGRSLIEILENTNEDEEKKEEF